MREILSGLCVMRDERHFSAVLQETPFLRDGMLVVPIRGYAGPVVDRTLDVDGLALAAERWVPVGIVNCRCEPGLPATE